MANPTSKIFVYVATAQHKNFTDNVINKYNGTPAVQTAWGNKIAFLEKTQEIWTKGRIFGVNKDTSLGDIQTDISNIWAFLGVEKNTSAKSYTINNTNVSGLEPAFLKLRDYTNSINTEAKKHNTVSLAANSGGLKLTTSTNSGGGTNYELSADASMWEFRGSVTVSEDARPTDTQINTAINNAYATITDTNRKTPEVGDTWAVTLKIQNAGGLQESGTYLYACSNVSATNVGTFVLIGSAQGIADVNTDASHGVNIASNSGVIKANVTPGTVASGNDSVVTGDAVHAAITTKVPVAGTGSGGGISLAANGNNAVKLTVNTTGTVKAGETKFVTGSEVHKAISDIPGATVDGVDSTWNPGAQLTLVNKKVKLTLNAVNTADELIATPITPNPENQKLTTTNAVKDYVTGQLEPYKVKDVTTTATENGVALSLDATGKVSVTTTAGVINGTDKKFVTGVAVNTKLTEYKVKGVDDTPMNGINVTLDGTNVKINVVEATADNIANPIVSPNPTTDTSTKLTTAKAVHDYVDTFVANQLWEDYTA